MRGHGVVAFRCPPTALSLRGAVAQLGERPDSIGKVGGTTDDNRGPNSTISLWSMYWLYLLQSQITGRFYIGSTNDMARRLKEHNGGKSNATKVGRPWTVVYRESFRTVAGARRREREIKSWKNSAYLRAELGLPR